MTSPKTEDVKRGISVLWETLQCPICMELMTTPVSTKCGHQFCKFCMAKFLDSRKQKEANCPVCKMKITKRSLQESPGFQRLIEGLQNMIHAYEQDTYTNYFTGASQQRKQPIVTEPETNKHPHDVFSGDTSDPPGLDSDEDEEHDGLSRSHASTIAAKDGFARLMGLENSSPFTPEIEDLDTGFGDVPQTSEKKMDIRSTSPTEVLEPEMETEVSEVVEKATSRPRSRSKNRTTKCENRLILSPEEEQQQQQPLRKSSRNNKKKILEPDEILDRRQKKSLDKVSEWLMKIPPTEEKPEMENKVDACDSDDTTSVTGSCSPTSMAKIKQGDNDEIPKREERAKGLEERVFGVVYKRGRRGTRSFSPKNGVFVDPPVPPLPEEAQITGKIPKKRMSNNLSPADFVKRSRTEEKDDSALQDQIQIKEQENDTTDILKETNQMFIDINDGSDSNSTHKHGGELDKLPDYDENNGEDVDDSPAFDVLHQPGRKSKKKMNAPWQDVDADLQEQAKAKPDCTEKKGTGKKKSENAKAEKGKSIRVPKPLVLVGVREGESSPVEISKSGPTYGEMEVEIESYPSTQEPGTPVRRSTRRSKRLQLFTEEVRGSHKKTSIPKSTKANIPFPDGNLIKQFEAEEVPKMLDYETCSQNGKMGNVSKRNGCVYDEDMGGIEKMESSESTSTQLRATKAVTVKESIADIPNAGSTREANVSCSVAIVQSSRSPSEATVQNPVLESVSTANPVVNSPNIRLNAPLQTSENHANCEDMGGIMNMESVESASSQLRATKTAMSVKESFAEVPNTGSPHEANVACSVAVVPSSRSPTEATVPNPVLESFSPAIPVVNSPNDMRLNAPQETTESQTKCIALQEDEDMNDSEVDTEQLMKSFKVTKRKSFRLGSPTMKRSCLRSDKGYLRGSEIQENAHIGSGMKSEKDLELSITKECSIVQQEVLKEFDNSACGDLIPPSDSPSLNTSKSACLLQRGLQKSRISKSDQEVVDSSMPDSNGKSQDGALDGVSRNSVSGGLSPNKEAQSQIASPHLTLIPQAIDSGLLFPAFGVSEEDLSNLAAMASKQSQVSLNQLECSVTNMGEIKQSDLNHSVALHSEAVVKTACAENTIERIANSEGSVTPDDLVPVVSAVHQVMESGKGSGELSAHSPIKSNSRKRRRAQRLESSSESDCSGEEEELPPLAQIFRTSACPSSVERESSCLLEDHIWDQADSNDADGCEGVCVPADAVEPEGCLHAASPSPDFVNSSQASVDLFGTQEECDVPASDPGLSMELSQFSSEVLATQQKIAMQEELVRLEKMMALVSEVLQEKEGAPMAQVPSGTPPCQQNNKSTGHDLHATLPCGQGTNTASSAREAARGTGRNPSTPPPGSGATEGLGPIQPTPPKHEGVRGMARRSSRHSGQGAQSSIGAPKTTRGSGLEVKLTDKALHGASGSPSEGQEAKATNVQATNIVSAHIPERDRSRAKLVLVSSGLSSDEQVMVKRFAKRVGCRVVSQVTAETTHIVMKTDGELVCERTLKYFLGIAGRKWMVSFQWISECFQQDKVLDEAPFEVRGDVVNGPNHQGPLRARTTEENNQLMKGFKICFQGPFTDMTTDQLERMVELCGATVVKDPLLLDCKQKSHQLVIVQPGSEPSQSRYRALQRRATVVARGWLLDTVSTYTLQSHANYRL